MVTKIENFEKLSTLGNGIAMGGLTLLEMNLEVLLGAVKEFRTVTNPNEIFQISLALVRKNLNLKANGENGGRNNKRIKNAFMTLTQPIMYNMKTKESFALLREVRFDERPNGTDIMFQLTEESGQEYNRFMVELCSNFIF